MWNSLPCPQRLGDAVGVVEAGHLLVPGLGVDPDHVGVLELVMNASACPMEGSRMSPRGSLGLGSMANRMP
jgi:hypothetical protein